MAKKKTKEPKQPKVALKIIPKPQPKLREFAVGLGWDRTYGVTMLLGTLEAENLEDAYAKAMAKYNRERTGLKIIELL